MRSAYTFFQQLTPFLKKKIFRVTSFTFIDEKLFPSSFFFFLFFELHSSCRRHVFGKKNLKKYTMYFELQVKKRVYISSTHTQPPEARIWRVLNRFTKKQHDLLYYSKIIEKKIYSFLFYLLLLPQLCFCRLPKKIIYLMSDRFRL